VRRRFAATGLQKTVPEPPPEMSLELRRRPRPVIVRFRVVGSRVPPPMAAERSRTVVTDPIAACSAFAPAALRRDKPAEQAFICLQTTMRDRKP